MNEPVGIRWTNEQQWMTNFPHSTMKLSNWARKGKGGCAPQLHKKTSSKKFLVSFVFGGFKKNTCFFCRFQKVETHIFLRGFSQEMGWKKKIYLRHTCFYGGSPKRHPGEKRGANWNHSAPETAGGSHPAGARNLEYFGRSTWQSFRCPFFCRYVMFLWLGDSGWWCVSGAFPIIPSHFPWICFCSSLPKIMTTDYHFFLFWANFCGVYFFNMDTKDGMFHLNKGKGDASSAIQPTGCEKRVFWISSIEKCVFFLSQCRKGPLPDPSPAIIDWVQPRWGEWGVIRPFVVTWHIFGI